DPDVKFQVDIEKRLELFGQDVFIPSCIQCELVVGKRIGPLLGGCHVFKANTRDLGHLQELGGLYPAVASEDHVVPVNKDRVGEAERHYAVGNLANLLSRMGARRLCHVKQPAYGEIYKI